MQTPLYTTPIAIIKPDDLRKPGPQPIVPTGGYQQRLEWANDILHSQGAQIAGIRFAPECGDTITAEMIEPLTTRGIMIHGKPYRLSFVTQTAKSRNAILPVVNEQWASAAEQMFPKPGDVVRFGALMTPCRGGIKTVNARMLLIDDNDPRFKFIGDGSGHYDRAWYATNFAAPDDQHTRRSLQFRALINPDLPANQWWLGKGIVTARNLSQSGFDLILPMSCIKGMTAKPGSYQLLLIWGTMHAPDERRSGPAKCSAQITQWWTPEVFDAAKAHVAERTAQLQADLDNPVKFARHAVIRNEDGVIEQGEMLAWAADISEKLGNNLLMRSKMIAKMLNDVLANEALSLTISGGLRGRYLVNTVNNNLTPGFVGVHPKVFDRYYKTTPSATTCETVAVRYPHGDATEAVAVTVFPDPRCHKDDLVANEATFRRCAADSDGDQLVLFLPAPHITVWRNQLLHIADAAVKVREYGKPPETRAQMIAQIMGIAIGLIEHTITRWCAIKHKYAAHIDEQGDLVARVYNQMTAKHEILTVNPAKEIQASRLELQKGVDGIKKASMPNMDQIQESLIVSGMLVNKKDYGYRYLDNGTLPAYRRAPQISAESRQARLGVKSKQYVTPDGFVRPTTPLGANILQVNKLVPHAIYHMVDNARFKGWIEPIPGPGAAFAANAVKQFTTAMQIARQLIDNDNNEAYRNAIREATAQFRALWVDKLATQTEEWLEQAASQIWNTWANSEREGYILWYSLPEVWSKMLIQRKDQLAGFTAITDILIGRSFAEIMEEHTVRHFNARLNHDNGTAFLSLAGVTHQLRNGMQLKPGEYQVTVTKTNTSGRWAVTFTAAAASVESPQEQFLTIVDDAEMDNAYAEPSFDDAEYISE